MMKRLVSALVALLVVYAASLPAATSPYFPVGEIKPGMEGTGLTVWQGSRVDEFKVHILGVVRNVIGPRRDLILARLEGGPLGDTGVIAGMSGSPVYIDGRLIGAVSYSLGAFSKQPIAGITPIEEMMDAARLGGSARTPGPASVQLDLPLTRESLASAFRAAFASFRPFADRASDVQVLSGADGDLPATEVGALLRPIATPLVMAGFSGPGAELLGSSLKDSGFVPTTDAARAAGAAGAAVTLKPGDAVGINLISGDLTLGGIGTVTAVEDDRIYAFGHPFYNLGPVQFPMTQAYVHALLPSLTTSTKLASTGDTIGTVQQDRATAVAGVLGKGPEMIPVRIALVSDRGFEKTFNFRIVNDQLFTPLLTYLGILDTLGSYEREAGTASFSVKGQVTVKAHDAVAFEDLFTGSQPSVGAATYVAAPMTFLLQNDFEPVQIEGLDLTITSTEQPRTATIERVWLDDPRPGPGARVPLKVLMRTYRGEEVVRTLSIDIPPNATGSLSVMVSDGTRLAQWERREARQPVPPKGLPQLIRALNRTRKNNRLYVRLLGVDLGAVVNGESLPSLPPSVLDVLEADRNGGDFVPLRTATLGEWDVLTDYAVVGSRLLTFRIGTD